MQLKYCGVTILDSLNFLSMPLADIPKAYGLVAENAADEEIRKGFYPHWFNRTENWGVELDCLPDKRLVVVVVTMTTYAYTCTISGFMVLTI